MTDAELTAARIAHVRDVCRRFINHDNRGSANGLTDRQWLAQTVLNILDGNIDAQITDEAHVAERP